MFADKVHDWEPIQKAFQHLPIYEDPAGVAKYSCWIGDDPKNQFFRRHCTSLRLAITITAADQTNCEQLGYTARDQNRIAKKARTNRAPIGRSLFMDATVS